jgi:hypothetical protein
MMAGASVEALAGETMGRYEGTLARLQGEVARALQPKLNELNGVIKQATAEVAKLTATVAANAAASAAAEAEAEMSRPLTRDSWRGSPPPGAAAGEPSIAGGPSAQDVDDIVASDLPPHVQLRQLKRVLESLTWELFELQRQKHRLGAPDAVPPPFDPAAPEEEEKGEEEEEDE